jgi:hypothetical protein
VKTPLLSAVLAVATVLAVLLVVIAAINDFVVEVIGLQSADRVAWQIISDDEHGALAPQP